MIKGQQSLNKLALLPWPPAGMCKDPFHHSLCPFSSICLKCLPLTFSPNHVFLIFKTVVQTDSQFYTCKSTGLISVGSITHSLIWLSDHYSRLTELKISGGCFCTCLPFYLQHLAKHTTHRCSMNTCEHRNNFWSVFKMKIS